MKIKNKKKSNKKRTNKKQKKNVATMPSVAFKPSTKLAKKLAKKESKHINSHLTGTFFPNQNLVFYRATKKGNVSTNC